MRAVLIVNPTATSTTTAGRDLLAHALESRMELTIEHTRHRGHGGEIAHAAVQDGADLVVVHGGDGTVSNVVNGLLGPPGPLPTGHIPALAIVPGGSANVTARQLGIPPGPIDATNQLIWLLDRYGQEKKWRRIGLIDCGERWAILNAGMGVDAEAVAKSTRLNSSHSSISYAVFCLKKKKTSTRLFGSSTCISILSSFNL